MEEVGYPCSASQADPLDRETFARVWRRVMPEDRIDCPFTLDPAPAVRPVPTAMPASAVTVPVAPTVSAVCLGEDSSAAELPQLEALLQQMTDDYRICHTLAQRLRITGLATLAEEKRRLAKRLDAARFLISGTRFTVPPTPSPRFASTALALRDRFQTAQRMKAELLTAAQTAADACLAGLYRTLAEETDGHAHQIWRMVERL